VSQLYTTCFALEKLKKTFFYFRSCNYKNPFAFRSEKKNVPEWSGTSSYLPLRIS